MKIAFDEHIPSVIVKIFQGLANDGDILEAEIVSAKEYVAAEKEGDVPWLKKFASAGGKVIISGDVRMRSRQHERLALQQGGFTAFYFTGAWSQKNNFVKSAMLLFWWPKIQQYIEKIEKPKIWEVPCQWTWKPFKDVTGPKVEHDG